jgi:hypothetical protein
MTANARVTVDKPVVNVSKVLFVNASNNDADGFYVTNVIIVT